jgi:hypothetical protein
LCWFTSLTPKLIFNRTDFTPNRLLECLLWLTRDINLQPSSTTFRVDYSTVSSVSVPAPTTVPGGERRLREKEGEKEVEKEGEKKEEHREEVLQLMRSRAQQLLHYCALLLHTVLAQLLYAIRSHRSQIAVQRIKASVIEVSQLHCSCYCAHRRLHACMFVYVCVYVMYVFLTAIIQLLLYYGDDLVSWLELHCGNCSEQTGSFVYNSSNTVTGLAHAGYNLWAAVSSGAGAGAGVIADARGATKTFRVSEP